ncbi:hypothetical protein Tco_0851902 [Tanacetum coccineum]
MFMNEIVESEFVDVITVVTPSNVKTVESKHESANVKDKGVHNTEEPKTTRKNSFSPPIIEDWNSDDESEVAFIPNNKDKTIRPSTEKIKFVKSAKETVEKDKQKHKEWMEGNVTSLYETMLLQYQAEVGEGPKKPRQAKRGRDTKIPQSGGPPEKVGDEAVHKELGDRMERAATTVSCLEAKQDSDAQTRFEIASKKSYDPPLSRVNTFRSGEDSMKLLELIEICTKLSDLVKIVNEEAQIQALVDRKKVIVTETSIRRALHLQDAEGIDCLPNATIFAELERMGAKTTAWNEFCSTIASAIICLATNQQFNFSKYIFDNMVKNLEGRVKFLMYPRFVQVFLNKQVEGMFKHKETYDIPSHSKKVFANMKRPGNKFSGRITPLFPTILVQAQEEIGEGSTNSIDTHHTPTNSQPSRSQPQQKQKLRKSKKKNTKVPHFVVDENVTPHSNDLLLSGEDSLKLNEFMDLRTQLSDRVLALETTKKTQALEIASLKRRVNVIPSAGEFQNLYHVGVSQLLSEYDRKREDLETLWKLVKAKHRLNRPVEDYERVLWGDLKVMFEPDIKSEVWRNLQGYKVTI